jgi:hypothetical protein
MTCLVHVFVCCVVYLIQTIVTTLKLCTGVPLTPEEEIELARRRQVIVHSNTCLTTNPFDEQQNKETIHQLAQSQAQSLEGKIGVDGKELIHAETPKVNGFSFVKTPSPAPGAYNKHKLSDIWHLWHTSTLACLKTFDMKIF